MRLANKVIIVTGSTTGIGKAMALRFVQEGARIVLHGLEAHWGQEVLQQLGTEKAVLHIEDITAPGAAKTLVDLAITRFGQLDAIVNNAALVASSNLQTTDTAYFEKLLAINTIAPFNLIKTALPWLQKQQGVVLNIGSINAYAGEPNLLAYSVSKGALMTLTRNLGDTLFRENKVRVNQLNPGWVLTETEMIRKKEQGLAADWAADLPAVYAPGGRIIFPAEIAAAAVYWVSDESAVISGQVIDLEQYPMIGRNPPKDAATLQRKV
jgi:NAD(P)-dependent dehydrogenase (short-subunit alcohol dehydrogenase family)